MEVAAGPEWIRAMNRSRVLHLIRTEGPISRAVAAVRSGLTRPTISAVVAELMADGWIAEIGTAESSGGRPPILLRFNPEARWVVGAELGAGHVRAVLTDLNGRVHRRAKRRVVSNDPQVELEALLAAIADVRTTGPTREERAEVAGVGVGITGQVDRAAGLWRYSPHFEVSDLPVRSIVAERLGVPVLIENDARAMAWGERAFGAARGADNLVYIRVGVGIGAGILLDGKLYSGAHQGAGEIGHTVVDDSGPRCRCGSYGCLEAMASATAIARRAIKRIAHGESSNLPDRVGGDLDAVICTTVIEAAVDGDAVALDTLRQAAQSIGLAVGNLINLLNPEMVIIGGGTSRAGALLIDPLREAALAKALPGIRNRTKIAQTLLGEDSCPIGGAALMIDQLLSVPYPG